ncbi:MAG: hypothetical protein ABEN55_20740 [Bradymonadaceae bacterium]
MRYLGLGWLVVLLAAGGCDDVRLVEEGGGGAPEPIIQSGVLESRLSADGIESLLKAAHPDGVTVTHQRRRHRRQGRQVTIGPISQSVRVDNLQISIRNGRLELLLVRNEPTLAVPVRIDQNASVRICRFQVAAAKLIVTAEAANGSDDQWTFEVDAPPDVSMASREINPINPCPPLENDEGVPVASIRSRLTDYVETAVQRGIRNYVAVSFVEELGMLRGTTALRRISPFDNRRGTIRLASYPAKNGDVGLDPQGTTLTLDMGVSAKRAACVPPDDLPSIGDTRPADRIEAADLEGRGIDAGFALAEPLLGRMLRAAILGGFLCRGLAPDTSAESQRIARHRARLGAVGLDGVPGNGPVESVVSPGELPDLDLRPRDGSLAMQWDGLSVDLYGNVAGTRVRLLSVTANFALRLHPTDESRESHHLAAVDQTPPDSGLRGFLLTAAAGRPRLAARADEHRRPRPRSLDAVSDSIASGLVET